MSASSALSLRISPKDRALFDQAAKVAGKTRTQFMMDSVRSAATETILDQRLFRLDAAEFAAFEKALAKAPKVADVLAKLRKRPSPWKE